MLRSLDIAVLLGARLREPEGWTFESLSSAMGISRSQAHRAVSRCRSAGLMYGKGPSILVEPVLELLEHGVRWVYYPELGSLVRGVPTAHSGPVMHALVATTGADPIVWQSSSGEARGQALKPLYTGAPQTRSAWPELYEVLTLVDVLRVGRRREVSLAMDLLRDRISA